MRALALVAPRHRRWLIAGFVAALAGPQAADDLAVSHASRWVAEGVATIAFVATLAVTAGPARARRSRRSRVRHPARATAWAVAGIGVPAVVVGPYAAYLPTLAWWMLTMYAIAASGAASLAPRAALAASARLAARRPWTSLALTAALAADLALAALVREAVPNRLLGALAGGVVADAPLGILAVLLAAVVDSRGASGERSVERE